MVRHIEAAVTSVAQSVQPLVFETRLPDAPFSQSGTVFFIGRAGKARVVTSRHALRPETLWPICVFPADGKRKLLPLKQVSYVSENLLPDDFLDIAMIEIDLAEALGRRQGFTRLIDLDLPLPDWRTYRDTSDFVVVGYPRDRSYVDYSQRHIYSERVALYGRYSGPGESRHVHSIKVDDTKGLSSFGGFSGGPVFCLAHRLGFKATLLFCGMAIQGSPESGLIHFIESSVVIDAAEVW